MICTRLLVVLPLLLLACAVDPGDGDEDSDGEVGVDTGEVVEEPHAIVLTDAYNYGLETSMQVEVIAVENCPNDLTVDWSALTEDLGGNPMDPSEVTMLRVVRFYDLEPEEIVEDITSDTLTQADIAGYVDYLPVGSETDAVLTQFEFNGTSLDPATEICASLDSTYMLLAMTGPYDYRMLVFFVPVEGETNTTVAIHSDSASIEHVPDLEQGDAIVVPAASDTLVDWSALSVNGQGNPFSAESIDELILARYELTLEEVEERFAELPTLAAESYAADVGGRTTLASKLATDGSGQAFAGFEGEGIWLLGLFSSTELLPVPLFLGVVEPEI